MDLIAVVGLDKKGRRYFSATPDQVRAADVPEPKHEPLGGIFEIPGRINVVGYGLDEWSKLFTARQLRSVMAISNSIRTIHDRIAQDAVSAGYADDARPLRDDGEGATAYADAVVTYLSLGFSKFVDINNALARWEPIAQCPRQLFKRQGIPMVWDFAEANPYGSSSGSFLTSLDGVRKALTSRAAIYDRTAEVEQRDAKTRVVDAGAAVLSTDPPYYDNIHYADLSDFFYIWLRRNLSDIWPNEFATLLTPKVDELVANSSRAGSKYLARSHFERGLSEFFAAAAAHSNPDFPATVFYAFKATEFTSDGVSSTGWETFLAGLLESGYMISATWPVRTELSNRMLASGTNALASSVVLACRQRPEDAPLATRGEFLARLRADMNQAVRLLQDENIAPVDLAQSAIGPGMAVFSRYRKVVEADGSAMTVRAALGLINEALAEILSGEESEFDADTRFALTWFEQYGHGVGPFGDADLLARAKDTTVAGTVQAGIVASREGRVRLVARSELPETWDPATDGRLTVWETTHYLIRALESSESEAAALVSRLGIGFSDRSRQLAYLLYGVCDKRKWADEAGAYNMLVTAWPELARLAAAGPVARADDERLF